MKYVLPIVLLLVLALAQNPTAQENGDPISWADLRADTIIFDFPAPDSLLVRCQFSIFNGTFSDTIIVSEIGIFLDDVPVWGEPIDVTKSMNNCHVFSTYEECEGECNYLIGPPIEVGDCTWYIYMGPPDSVTHEPGCVCMKKWGISRTVYYTGQDIVKFVLDPADVVWEPNESDNSFSTHLRPVSVRKETWGKIKSLYAE